jgi:methyl-accepting chemotaxis protein
MYQLLRRSSIRLRLVALALLPLAAMSGVALVAISGLSTQRQAATATAASESLAQRALQVKYQAADWNGWQTAYAFDAIRGVRNAASDTGDSRKAFLASGAALARQLGSLASSHGLTNRQSAQVAAALAAVKDFNTVDAQIAAGYASSDPKAQATANKLVITTEITNYQKAATAVQALSADLTAQAARNTRAASRSAASGKLTVLIAVTLGFVIAGAAAVVVIASISRPLRQLEARLLDITAGEGDLTATVDESGSDEVSRTAALFNQFVGQIAGVIRLVAESSHAVAASAEELTATTTSISASSEEASVQAASVAEAARQVSANVETVAAGAEQMGASISEISQNAAEAARVAGRGVDVVSGANTTVEQLGESSRQIGDVIKVIASIAEQTNLLALNATIEAARAGEAGKGFAVVAGEVKDLAQETARATEDITRRVDAIQHDALSAVSAISEISDVMQRINDFQLTVAAAVEEQIATTQEMSRNVAQAAAGSGEIAANITGVADASVLTAQGVTESQQAVNDLARLSSELQALISRFRY